MTSEFADAATLAAQIASGQVSARAALDDVMGRIDSDLAGSEPALNAVVVTRADAARREADAIDDARARGERLGPLAGVPVTVKEAFDVAGLPTTWGLSVFTGHRATTDAEVVNRLRAAGAVIVGKTNVASMLADFAQTDNEVYGRTLNPHDRGRSPGGSSGGAAAVAAGHSYLDVGSDLAGSIRVPAAWCGVYGLKASAGAIPTRGFQPPGPPAAAHPLSDMLALGPFARSANDLLLAHTVLSRPASPQPGTPVRGLAGCRVGVVLDDAACPTDPATAAALSDLIDALAARGAAVRHGWPEGVDPAKDGQAFGALVNAYLAFADPEQPDPAPQDYADALQRKRSTAAAWQAHFAETDIFLMPAVVTTAITHDTRPFDQRHITIAGEQRTYLDLAHWIAPASLPGLPAVTTPIGLDHSGLPIGMQVLAARDHDPQAIHFAELCARITR